MATENYYVQNKIGQFVKAGIYYVYLPVDISVVSSPLLSSLFAYYKLGESSGTIVDSVNGYNSTACDASYGYPGKIGTALSFGTTNNVTLADQAAWTIDSSGDFSACAWVYLDRYITTASSMIWGYGTGGPMFYLRRNGTNDQFGIAWYQGGGAAVGTDTASYSAGVWYHVAVTKEVSTGVQCRMYRNGVADGTPTDMTPNTIDPAGTFIGNADTDARPVVGRICELGLWNRVLSSDEILALYNNYAGMTYPFDSSTVTSTLLSGIVGYWALDETIGTAIDLVNRNNGAMVGSIVQGLTGKIDKCVGGDGTSMYINVGDVAALNVEQLTLSVWFDISVNSYDCPASKINGGLSAGWAMTTESTKLRVRVADNATHFAQLDSTTTVTTGAWFHAVMTSDGTNLKLYINGSQEGSDTAFPYSIGYESGIYSKFQIGARGEDPTAFFKGGIDEVGVWNRALTTTEITELYNAGSGKTYPFA